MDNNTNFGQNKKMGAEGISPEQMQNLFKKLSSDELKDVQETFQKCSTEILLTRGLPVTSVILGSLYLARTRLPPQYHFGPKGWPFYALLGVGCMTATSVLSMGSCKDRIMPKIEALWKKYELDAQPRNTYEQLRMRNRQGASYPQQHLPQEQQQHSYDYGHASTAKPFSEPSPITSGAGMAALATQPQMPVDKLRHGPLTDEVSYMSGTPMAGARGASSNPSPAAHRPTKTNQYGDEGFS
ncbi:unnamed protein product, partial [Mesorhabditis belari]|uniref:Uncharacterized protein n=1 Tax=Mesorhabditis belari TaxID=2138241 RepID=A0AAF3ET54_9BILA